MSYPFRAISRRIFLVIFLSAASLSLGAGGAAAQPADPAIDPGSEQSPGPGESDTGAQPILGTSPEAESEAQPRTDQAPPQTPREPELRFGYFPGPTALALIRVIDPATQADSGFVFAPLATSSPDQMVARIVNREVDAAVLPANLAVKLANAGQPIRLAAITGTGMLSLVTSRADIGSLADLAGRRIHVAGQGSTPDLVFRSLLVGVEPRPALDFSLPYPEITAALIAGRIDTAVIPEPFATMAVLGRQDLHKRIDIETEWANGPGGGSDYPMTILVVRSDFADKRPAATAAFFRAVSQSIDWVKEQPRQAGQRVAELGLGIGAEAAAQSVADCGFVYLAAGSSEGQSLLLPYMEFLLRTVPEAIGGRLPDPAVYLDLSASAPVR